MTYDCKKIFVGGYTKSGTTFVGRAFDIINGVYARGEEDYFRQFFKQINKHIVDYNTNLHYVNKEVYDGFGSLKRMNNDTVRSFHQFFFYHLFFNGEPMPQDCLVTVEKSPHNIFWLDQIRFTFPDAKNVCVYRPAKDVFRSLMRHMRDHRDPAFEDPESSPRKEMFTRFCIKWHNYVKVIEKNRQHLSLVHYQSVADDTIGFLDFAQKDIIGEQLGLSAPIETLTKEHYLSTLPPEVREKSLVQTAAQKIVLSDNELNTINDSLGNPDTSFDF